MFSRNPHAASILGEIELCATESGHLGHCVGVTLLFLGINQPKTFQISRHFSQPMDGCWPWLLTHLLNDFAGGGTQVPNSLWKMPMVIWKRDSYAYTSPGTLAGAETSCTTWQSKGMLWVLLQGQQVDPASGEHVVQANEQQHKRSSRMRSGRPSRKPSDSAPTRGRMATAQRQESLY